MFLKVPIDILPPENFSQVIDSLLPSAEDTGNPSQANGRDIVLLSLSDLLRARRKGEYRNYVQNAALVIPISKSIVSGVRFLTKKKIFRYMPFNFAINLLSVLEKNEQSLYLLGGKSNILSKAERNIRSTFPHIGIVGRHDAAIKKREEPGITEAIRKASPALLLAGKGIRGKELWIPRNSSRISPGFRLWCSDLFEVFAKKKRHPSNAVFERGLESLVFFLQNPLRFFRILPYFRYKALLLIYKIFKIQHSGAGKQAR